MIFNAGANVRCASLAAMSMNQPAGERTFLFEESEQEVLGFPAESCLG